MQTDLSQNINNELQVEQTTINAKELFWKYFQHGWLFILIIILSLTGAWLYLRYTKPVYSVSSTLLIRNENSSRGAGSMNSQDMFSDIALFQSSSNKQNEILILKSRAMMERVVRKLQLQKSFSVVGNVKMTDIYPEQPFELEILSLNDTAKFFSLNLHFSNDWSKFKLNENGSEYFSKQIVNIPQGKFRIIPRNANFSSLSYREFNVSWMPLQSAAMRYLNGLQVKPANDQSTVLSLDYAHENPILATDILNELMHQYNNAAIEDKNEMNRKILTFINDRLDLVEGQLDSVEFNLQNFRTSRHVIDLASQSSMYFENVSELNSDLRSQEVQYHVVELLEQYLTQSANQRSLVPSTLGLTDPTLLELTAGYNLLVSNRLKELQTGATPNNPVVKNLENNIEEARLKMLQNLSNIKKVYLNNINKLKSESKNIRQEIASIPQRERETREKARQQEIKQNLYLYLMQKREESEISQASTIANSRIIDTALPVLNLVNPLPIKIYGIALLIGLLLPVGIISFKDLLNDKVTTKADIQKGTSAPVLGEIGHSAEEKVLLFPNKSRTVVAEQMRILRSNLRFVLRDKIENPTILVTSSFSGEGKSFISTNIGATLAISGKKTVILEFDLRKPKILAGLDLPKSQGLTNYLVGGATLEEIAQRVPQVDNLFVIPCGPVPPNPSEILLTNKIPELFTWLKSHYDAVIIDTAPVGLVSDSFTLGQYADSTLYVVRQRYTFKRQLAFIEELYKQKKLPNMGILVNDVITDGAKGYYGYGSGAYGYGYGYGYASNGYYEETKKKKWWA